MLAGRLALNSNPYVDYDVTHLCMSCTIKILLKLEVGRVPGDYPVPAGYYFKIWPEPDPWIYLDFCYS